MTPIFIVCVLGRWQYSDNTHYVNWSDSTEIASELYDYSLDLQMVPEYSFRGDSIGEIVCNDRFRRLPMNWVAA